MAAETHIPMPDRLVMRQGHVGKVLCCVFRMSDAGEVRRPLWFPNGNAIPEQNKFGGTVGDTSRNGILCTLTTAADRGGVQALASNLPQTRAGSRRYAA